jgi:signal transduction histidine kinase
VASYQLQGSGRLAVATSRGTDASPNVIDAASPDSLMAIRPPFSGRGGWIVIPLLVCLPAPPVAAWAQPQKQVLALYSTRRDAQILTIGDRELPRILEQGPGGVDDYAEYIGEARLSDPAYQAALRDFLRLKYGGVRIDAVIALEAPAMTIVSQAPTPLFPGSPIVFFASSPVPGVANATGLAATLGLAETMEFIGELVGQSAVPEGARQLFKEPTVWERYRLYILGTVAVLLAQTFLIVGLLLQRRRRRLAEDQARRSQEALQGRYERVRDLGSRLLKAHDTERSRIARELHDDISQQVALLSSDLELLLGGAVTQDSEALVGEAWNRTQQIAISLHDLSHRLHPAKLRLIGLVAGLQALQREMSHSDLKVTFTHDNVHASPPPELTVTLFRIAQEAVQNAVKHSNAETVRVHLQGGSTDLVLTVSDDGEGFDVHSEWGKGLGLISIGERAEAVGGKLTVRSQPGAGTSLTVHVPVGVEPVSGAAAAGHVV